MGAARPSWRGAFLGARERRLSPERALALFALTLAPRAALRAPASMASEGLLEVALGRARQALGAARSLRQLERDKHRLCSKMHVYAEIKQIVRCNYEDNLYNNSNIPNHSFSSFGPIEPRIRPGIARSNISGTPLIWLDFQVLPNPPAAPVINAGVHSAQSSVARWRSFRRCRIGAQCAQGPNASRADAIGARSAPAPVDRLHSTASAPCDAGATATRRARPAPLWRPAPPALWQARGYWHA